MIRSILNNFQKFNKAEKITYSATAGFFFLLVIIGLVGLLFQLEPFLHISLVLLVFLSISYLINHKIWLMLYNRNSVLLNGAVSVGLGVLLHSSWIMDEQTPIFQSPGGRFAFNFIAIWMLILPFTHVVISAALSLITKIPGYLIKLTLWLLKTTFYSKNRRKKSR